MLEAKSLYKTYVTENTHYEVLKNINLEIRDGESLAIIGKSGSGKSTLMHLLACLDTPSRGTITLDGADFSLLTEQERDALRNEKFGFVFQQFFLNGRETVLENVLLPMRVRGATQYKMIRSAMDALEAVGLKDLEDKPAKNLSGGEKQRVCIARAIVGKPKIVFADEPTGNLDSVTGEMVENILFDMNKNFGITLIIVTHDPELAQKCPRIVELKDGEIIEDSGARIIHHEKPHETEKIILESWKIEQKAASENAETDTETILIGGENKENPPEKNAARMTGELRKDAAEFAEAEKGLAEKQQIEEAAAKDAV